MEDDLARVLISTETLDARIRELAGEIEQSYTDPHAGITIVTVLSGSIIFLGDLIRQLPMKMRIGLVSVSSYAGRTTQSRGAVLTSASIPDVRGRDVLIIDDILDTGRTLRVVQDELRQVEPRSLKTAVLLRKPDKAPPDVVVDYVGFDIEDVFVVGYGLDFDGLYRNLPYIAVLKPEVYEAEHCS